MPGALPVRAQTLSAPGVTEIPRPLPPMGREVRRGPRSRAPLKHGHLRRIPRAQTYPLRMARSTLNTSPYYFAGYLSFRSGQAWYQGSGTVVRRKAVLTAAHNLWDVRSGWSTNVRFFRARYGPANLGSFAPGQIYVHGNYQPSAQSRGDSSSYTFGWDIGWMTFPGVVARGGYAGYATNYNALTGTNYCIAIGYGGGVYPKYCEPSSGYTRWRSSAYFTNSSYDHEGGMSGGPIFATIGGKRYVTAVVVSSGGGVRAIDSYIFNQLSKLP